MGGINSEKENITTKSQSKTVDALLQQHKEVDQ